MALIKCKNCGKDISDKATTCVHCGAKVDSKKNNKKLFLLLAIILVIIIVVGVVVIIKINSKPYLGKYTNEVTYIDIENETTVKSEFELKRDGTFIYSSYVNDSDPVVVKGTYTDKDGEITIHYDNGGEEQSIPLFIDNDKLCMAEKDCQEFFIKEGSSTSNKMTFRLDANAISYGIYLELLDRKDTFVAIVTLDGCPHCENLKDTVKEISNIKTPIYVLNNTNGDMKEVTIFPTTILVKNGKIVYKTVGEMSETEFSDMLKKYGFE